MMTSEKKRDHCPFAVDLRLAEFLDIPIPRSMGGDTKIDRHKQ